MMARAEGQEQEYHASWQGHQDNVIRTKASGQGRQDKGNSKRARAKVVPRANIDDISEALDTSHFEMLRLKDVPRANVDDISVTLDTCHFEMLP